MTDENGNVQIWVTRNTRKMLRQVQVEHDDTSLMDIYEKVVKEWLELDNALKKKGISFHEGLSKVKE